jgi:hypothetical protein
VVILYLEDLLEIRYLWEVDLLVILAIRVILVMQALLVLLEQEKLLLEILVCLGQLETLVM